MEEGERETSGRRRERKAKGGERAGERWRKEAGEQRRER